MNKMAGKYQGRQFGNYRLLTLIGEGGSSEVYLGKHLYLGTEAAIKILDTRLKDNEFAQFSNEAHTLIDLHHPNIVRILDFGMEAGVPYIVMSYAPYGSLGQRHPVGTHLPLAVIISYVNSIAAALQYAHEKHLIHRDIKPDNLLIGNEHEIVLSDFGIAVVAHNTHSLRTQDAIGTVTYMAPEQLRKKARPASDQYALGVVVYEWLCGEPPFDGSPIEVAMQHLHDSPQPLRDKIPDLAPAVEQVVLKALAKEPHQRFTSVREFAKALEQASHAERETAWERPRHERRSPEVPFSRQQKNLLSSPRKAALLALLLLVVLGAITGTSILSSLKHQPITTISAPRRTSLVHVSPGITSTVPGVSPHATSTGWTMFGYDAQHTEYNAQEHMLNPTNIPSLQTAWTSYTGYSLHPPVVANGVLYNSTSENVTSPDGNAYPVSTLYALDIQTGNVLWKKSNLPVQAGGQSLYDDSTSDIYTVAVANGVVYAAAVSGMLDALDARTGAQIWSRRITDAVLDTYQNAAPIVVSGTLYLHTINGNVYAVDARSGSVRWSTHVDVPINPRNGGASIPAEADGVVYVGGSQYLYALEARNGKMLWRGAVDSLDPFTPVVAQGIVYAATDAGDVFAFDASGCGTALCSPLWNSSFGLPKSTGALDQIAYPPAVANGVLYLGTVADSVFGGGYLFAVDARTGARLWNASIDSTGVPGEGGFYASPVVANGVVYVIGQDGQFYTFQATGCGSATCKPFWTASFRNNFGPGYSITVLDGKVYLATPGGTLYALRLP